MWFKVTYVIQLSPLKFNWDQLLFLLFATDSKWRKSHNVLLVMHFADLFLIGKVERPYKDYVFTPLIPHLVSMAWFPLLLKTNHSVCEINSKEDEIQKHSKRKEHIGGWGGTIKIIKSVINEACLSSFTWACLQEISTSIQLMT